MRLRIRSVRKNSLHGYLLSYPNDLTMEKRVRMLLDHTVYANRPVLMITDDRTNAHVQDRPLGLNVLFTPVKPALSTLPNIDSRCWIILESKATWF